MDMGMILTVASMRVNNRDIAPLEAELFNLVESMY
jgi:hypothetical protein